MTVLSLTTKPQEINQEAVRLLKEALKMAEEGDCRGVALVMVHVDESVSTMFSKTDRFGALLGALVRLQHRVVAIIDD